MRVLAVTQHVALLPRRAGPVREPRAVGRAVPAPTPIQDATATSYDAVWANASAASRWRCTSVKPPDVTAATHLGVPVRRDDDGDVGVVLGGAAHHRRSADVDLLDALGRARTRDHGVAERVEVGDDELERLDVQVGQLRDVVRVAHIGEQAGVHPRVQGLDPAVEALREAGQLLHRGHRHTRRRDPGRRRPGRDDRDPGGVQERWPGPPDRSCHRRTPALAGSADALRRPGALLALCGAQGIVTFLPLTVQPLRTIFPTYSTSWARSATLIRSVSVSSVSSASHRDGDLRDDHAGVDALVDDEKRCARYFYAVGEGITRAVDPREGRQQRVVRVEVAAAELAQERRPGQPQEPGRDDQVRPVRRDRAPSAPRPRPRGCRGRRPTPRRSARPAAAARSTPPVPGRSAPTATTCRAVRRVGTRLEQGLQVRATAGDQHDQTPSRPRSPRTRHVRRP